jgi:hypothetical protein
MRMRFTGAVTDAILVGLILITAAAVTEAQSAAGDSERAVAQAGTPLKLVPPAATQAPAQVPPGLTVAKIWLDSRCSVRFMVTNHGERRLPPSALAPLRVSVRAGKRQRSWPLGTIDPKGALTRPGTKVSFNSGIILSTPTKVTVGFGPGALRTATFKPTCAPPTTPAAPQQQMRLPPPAPPMQEPSRRPAQARPPLPGGGTPPQYYAEGDQVHILEPAAGQSYYRGTDIRLRFRVELGVPAGEMTFTLHGPDGTPLANMAYDFTPHMPSSGMEPPPGYTIYETTFDMPHDIPYAEGYYFSAAIGENGGIGNPFTITGIPEGGGSEGSVGLDLWIERVWQTGSQVLARARTNRSDYNAEIPLRLSGNASPEVVTRRLTGTATDVIVGNVQPWALLMGAPCERTYTVTVDPTDYVVENNETNNSLTASLYGEARLGYINLYQGPERLYDGAVVSHSGGGGFAGLRLELKNCGWEQYVLGAEIRQRGMWPDPVPPGHLTGPPVAQDVRIGSVSETLDPGESAVLQLGEAHYGLAEALHHVDSDLVFDFTYPAGSRISYSADPLTIHLDFPEPPSF